MSNNNFMEKVRMFLGLNQGPPRNDFRNPIWNSDDDDDDCDELYGKHDMDLYQDPMEVQREMTRHMRDMFKTFGNLFGDISVFVPGENFHSSILDASTEPDNLDESNIRDYYLKPGYQNRRNHHKDSDLDGQISSNELSGLFKNKGDSTTLSTITPFNEGNVQPGKSFFQTIITTSIKKPDGTVETRRIVKNENGIVEETTTETVPTPRSTNHMSSDILPAGEIYNNIITEFSSLWRMFN